MLLLRRQLNFGRARPGSHRLPGMNFRSECDYFTVAVDMLFQFKRRADDLGLFASIDFSEIDIVPRQDRVDVRNKRLHVTEYFKPGGELGKGWFIETPISRRTRALRTAR